MTAQRYNLFFVSPHAPVVGSKPEQAEAIVAVRNSAGNVVGYHALLTQEQYDYHVARNGKPITKAPAGVTKKLTYTSPATGTTVTKDCPVHQYAGVQLEDLEAKKIVIPDKVDDIDTSKQVTP